MPLNPGLPDDEFDIPAFPAYLRSVWLNSILPAQVPCQFSLWRPGPVVPGPNVGSEVLVSAIASMPITIQGIVGRVKVPSSAGDIGLDVLVNGVSILGTVLVIPEGLLASVTLIPTTPILHNTDLLTLACTAPGVGASDLSVHLLCMTGIQYP